MSKTFSTLTTELQKNTRLRIGLWLIVILLISYIVIILQDYQVQLQQNHQKAVARLNQLQTIATQTQWLERATETAALRTQLEVRLWQANTKGLAQATWQKWLDTQIKRAQMNETHLRITSAVSMPKYPKVWQITARLDAPFTPRSLNTLLLAMAQHPLFIVTERLDIRHLSKHSRFTLIASAYFQVPTN